MENERLKHDCAMMMAQHIIESLADVLPEALRLNVRNDCYHICKAGIDAFSLYRDRLAHRLNPTSN